ncbi:hypothetical protein FPHYL_7557 [Fusarium phyllophilum]|uniref:Uncharacterized protein n=1 Tax=Fusarium phyllophilum TaxID=47803 RepID=A0A8H5N9R3_9HYPO|nr:hypothetical protein FPHYL_7557 [Fusarium phyllophilum]
MDESHPPPGECSQSVGLPVTPQNQHTEAEVGDGSQPLPTNIVSDIVPTHDQGQAPPIRRGRGRPRGSKNKRTIATENAARQSQTRFPSPPPALSDERDSHQSWMGDEYIPSNDSGSPTRAIDTSRLNNEDGLVSADKYETQAVAEFIKIYRDSVHFTREKNRQSVTISRERIKEEERYKLAKLIDSHAWSQAQDEKLDGSWESGLVKAAVQRLPDCGAYLSSVFEISFHLCNMDPLSLLSMYHDFEFDNSGSDSFKHGGQMKRNPLWTSHFCDKLKRIMTHPLWTVICRTENAEGFSAEEARILSRLGCGNFSISPVLECFRLHQERSKTAGFITTPHAKLLALTADQAGLRAVPTSTDVMLVRTGDLDVVISALDSLSDCGLSISCAIHHLQYCASQTSRSYPSGLEELLEEYKWVWMKLERSKLCNAAANLPATQSDMFHRQAVGQGVPANNTFLPNNAVLGGFPMNPQQVGRFEPEGNPIRSSFDPNSNDTTRTIADHRDQLNPFQAFLTNQHNGAQSTLQNPFAKQPDPNPAQDPRMDGSEDGEIISIGLSDEEMMEEQLEHAPDVSQAAGGHPRKRDQARYQDRKRRFQTKKQRQRRHGGYGRPRSSIPQRQGGNNWGGRSVSGYERR